MTAPTYDRTDIELLRLLQNDARMSNKELSAAVGLAPSSCHERLKRLRGDGVLKGAHAEVDFAALGFQVEALLFVALEKHTREVVDEFLRDMVTIPEVRSAFPGDRRPRHGGACRGARHGASEEPGARPLHQPTGSDPDRNLDHLSGGAPV